MPIKSPAALAAYAANRFTAHLAKTLAIYRMCPNLMIFDRLGKEFSHPNLINFSRLAG